MTHNLQEVSAAGGLSHFAMRKPDAWDVLLAEAERVAAEHVGDVRGQAALLLPQVHELDDKLLERNRYYGLGLGALIMDDLLKDPVEQAQFTLRKQTAIVSTHQRYVGALGNADASAAVAAGMRLGEIRTDTFGPLDPLAKRTVAATEWPVRILADALTMVAYGRRGTQERTDSLLADQALMMSQLNGNRLALDLNQLDIGARRMLYEVLRKMHEHAQPKRQHIDYYDPLVRWVIDPASLRELDLEQIAFRGASFRIDEFKKVNRFVEVDAEGQPSIHQKHLKAAPPPVEAGGPLHEERLRCPALYISGMIPRMLRLTPEIIIGADACIRGETTLEELANASTQVQVPHQRLEA